MQKKKLKKTANNRGITLIALVITIIVLLILAGVSISLVAGENGILNKATSSVDETKKGAAIEQVSLAWSACQADYLASGGRVSKGTCFSASSLSANLSRGTITKASIGVDSTGTSELIYKTENTYYKMQVTANGEITIVGEGSSTEPTIKDPITPPEEDNEPVTLSDIKANPAEYYGKKVTGYTANGISDWRIFYADDSNVFLITTDYISSEKAVAANSTMTANGAYSVYWDEENVPEVADTTNVAKFSPVTTETMAWTGDYGTNANGKCVSTLLDTSKWTSFVDSNKATMAIGSPTLNMWVASWNAKYPTDKLYCNKSDATGYFVGTGGEATGNFISSTIMSEKAGYKVAENMYYSQKSEIDEEKCAGYWLASPAVYSTGYIIGVNINSGLYSEKRDDNRFAVRPVVCLKSGIEMTKKADGTIAIGNVQ